MGTYIGGLESALEDCDGVILSCDIAEILGPTETMLAENKASTLPKAYYFSTHGCSLVASFGAGAFDELPFVAAAALRALRSKKLAIFL